MGRLGLAWRFARCELRGGMPGFIVLLACLTLGVGAIAAVGVINAGVLAGLTQDSSSLLGGDIEIESTNQPLEESELAAVMPKVDGRSSRIVRTSTLVRAEDGRRLVVELKAVDEAYPLYGAIALDPPDLSLDAALADRGAVVEAGLLTRLSLDIGDKIWINDLTFTIRAVVTREPDRVDGFINLGPRVLISLVDLQASGLVVQGSLARYSYRFALANPGNAEARLAEIRQAHPDVPWRVNGVRDVQPRVTRVVDRLASYLTIAGLASLLIGGVGVALAIHNYLAGKTPTIATLKCLGASSRLIFQFYLLQVMLLATAGIALGLFLGLSVPYLVRYLAADVMPIRLVTGFYPAPLLIAAGCGYLTALAFALLPLARAREISPAGMFRALIVAPRVMPRPWVIALLGLSIIGLAAFAVLGVSDKLLAWVFVAAAAAAAVLLALVAHLLLAASRRLGRVRSTRFRMALANLNRPGAHALSVVVALGAGLTVLTLVALLNRNLTAELEASFGERVPALFFIDIQTDQIAELESLVRAAPDAAMLQVAPIIRGRVVRIKGVPVDQTGISHWTLRRDRGLSYAADMPADTTLIAGSWWAADHDGPPLVSIEDDIAEAYDVGVGDHLTFNVLGRTIEAEIASLRPEIDWSQGRLDFVFLFSPGVLESAPKTYASAVDLPVASEALLIESVADRLPNVTPISMREVSARLGDIVGRVRFAVLAVAVVTLCSGMMVLAGAIAAARRRHIYEAAVLKVLGATRLNLLSMFALEYLTLGTLAALAGALLGTLGAGVIVVMVMELPWVWAPGATLAVLLIALVLTLAGGFAGTWRVLGRSAGSVLRSP